MSRTCRIHIALIFFAVLSSPASYAQAPQPLTLSAAVHTALQRNPKFAGAQDQAEAARDRLGETRAGWYPNIDFSQGFTRGDDPVYVFGTLLRQRQFTAANFALPSLNEPRPLDNFPTRFDGQFSLFDSGKTFYRSQGAKRLKTAADFETEQARQDLILEVVQNYFGVVVAREDLLAAQQAVKSAEANEQRIETMQKAGLVVDADLLSAQVFLAQMKDRRIRARNDLEIAQMTLARDMGLAPDALPEPTQTLAEPSPMTRSPQDWMKSAAEDRPALRAAQLQAEASTSQRKAVRADFGPQVGLFADFERDSMALVSGPSGTNWTAGARLDLNLFAGGAQKARLAEATANERSAKHDLEWFRSGVMMQVRQAYLDATAAAERAAAANTAVEQARASLQIIENRYQAGLTDITELLRAQTAQLDARTEYLSALHDWQVACARLEYSAGDLTADSDIVQAKGAP
jgi:outer membrane protein TolC